MKEIKNILNLADNEKVEIADVSSKAIYLVTSFGRVFSVTAKEIKPNYNKKRGYFYLRNGNGGKILHRLVGELFLKKVKGKDYINHKDGNKKNNHVDNLEWCTQKENLIHARDNGMLNTFKKNEGRIKFTNEQVEKVVNLIKEKGYTYVQAGATEGMSYSTVAHIMTGRRRKIDGIKQHEEN